ncbi:hypothetical protein Stok01_02226 [Sulfurisphaera tokodaii]
MRKKLVSVLMIATAVVFLGLSFYLHSIDHPIHINSTIHINPTNISVSQFQVQFSDKAIAQISQFPPPWYANLWPETLVAGIILLLISVILLIRLKPSPL